MASKTQIERVSELQPVARLYAESHGLGDGDYIVNWHFINWASRMSDNYEKVYGFQARRRYGNEHYYAYIERKIKEGD